MLNAYETHLLRQYLFNIVSGTGHRLLDIEGLADWLGDHLHHYSDGVPLSSATSAGMPEPSATPINSPEMMLLRKTRKCSNRRTKHGVKAAFFKSHKLQQIREALRMALADHPPEPDQVAFRLHQLGNATELDSLDVEILELMVRYRTNSVIESFFDRVFEKENYGRACAVQLSNKVVPACLGCSTAAFLGRLRRDRPLLRTGLLAIDASDGELHFPERLFRLFHDSGEKDEDIVRLMLDRASPGELEWHDFDHVAQPRSHIENLLQGALRSRAKGVNILLYGPPGTGKTEFCKVLAKQMDTALYVVGEPDDSGYEWRRKDPDRKQELVFAQRLLTNNRNSLLLFDEMIDLLEPNPGFGSLFSLMSPSQYAPTDSQVHLHRILEESPVPILWTMNDARKVSPTILRRMMFALELRQPNARIRSRVWARQLAKNEIIATDDQAQELAREFDAPPAVAAGATRAAALGGGSLDTVRFGVRSLSRLLSCNQPPQKDPAEFDLGLVRADIDPQWLAERVVSTARRDFSFCLQGPPGTGKSAFVRYLADRLGLEVMQQRASDLLSPWVGMNEQNIAQAFAEARDREAFLIFDEADSLLSERRKAHQGWQVSQTNEMLTWMESHPLPFACTTNFVDQLDEASLRRFTFKVALDYLTAPQARLAFSRFFALDPTPQLELVAALTPGDFAVVRRKAEILGCLQEADTLTAMLRNEYEAKPHRPKMIGFHP